MVIILSLIIKLSQIRLTVTGLEHSPAISCLNDRFIKNNMTLKKDIKELFYKLIFLCMQNWKMSNCDTKTLLIYLQLNVLYLNTFLIEMDQLTTYYFIGSFFAHQLVQQCRMLIKVHYLSGITRAFKYCISVYLYIFYSGPI